MTAKRARTCLGIATFELAIMMVALAALLAGGFAMSSYMQRTYEVGLSLEERLHADEFRALHFVGTSEGLRLESQSKLLTDLLNDTADRIERENLLDHDSSRYFVEVGYLLIEIDPISGIARGPVSMGFEHRGSLRPSADVASKTDLVAAFQSRSRETFNDGSSRSPYATPFDDPNLTSGTGYLPAAVLIGARIIISIEDDLGGRMYSALGGEPYVFGSRVEPMRGEIG